MNPPTLIIDTREQAPLPITRLPCRVDTLTTGDYALAGFEAAFAVERKSLDDLAGSLTAGRERFMREVNRLRAFEFARLLVIGTREDVAAGRYRSALSPRAALASLFAIEARGVPVCFAPTPEEAGRLVEAWAVYFYRERAKQFATEADIRELTAGLAL